MTVATIVPAPSEEEAAVIAAVLAQRLAATPQTRAKPSRWKTAGRDYERDAQASRS